MKTGNLMKNKIYIFLDYVFRLIMINLLIIVPSFSFLFIYSYLDIASSNWLYVTLIPMALYFYPGVVAGFDVIRLYEDEKSTGIFKEFFTSFKKHYLKSLLFGLIILIIIILLSNSVYYFYQQATLGIGYLISFIVTCSVVLIGAMVMVHLPITAVYFDDLTIKDSLQLTLMMAFKDLWRTFLMVIIVGIFVVVDLLSIYVLLIIGVSGFIYLLIKISFKRYIMIKRKIENKES